MTPYYKEIKMKTKPIFKRFNFVSTTSNYKIKKINGCNFIIGKELRDTKIEPAENDEPLCVQFANINLSNEKEILHFCQKYGLPFSSYKYKHMPTEENFEKEYYMIISNINPKGYEFIPSPSFEEIVYGLNYRITENDHNLITEALNSTFDNEFDKDTDYILLDTFCRLNKLIKSILIIADYILKGEKAIANKLAIFHLAYLLLFYKKYFYKISNSNFNSETGQFCKKLQTELMRLQNLSRTKDKYVQTFKPLNEQEVLDFIKSFNPDFDSEFTLTVIKFLSSINVEYYYHLLNYDATKEKFDETFNFIKNSDTTKINQIFTKNFAAKVISDIINDEIANVTHEIFLVENSFKEFLKADYLLQYIFTDLYNLLLYQKSFTKCEYINCNNFFMPDLFYKNKRFCCRECAKKANRKNKSHNRKKPN